MTSNMAMDIETVIRNINRSLDCGYPDFWNRPEVFKYKGKPIAIVAGGPSMNEYLDEIRNHEVIMVCGSAHDHLIAKGINPHYCVVLDPDPITANYLKTPVKGCVYLVASQCDKAVFDALEGFDIWVWNCAGANEHKLFRGQASVGGGCTVTLRAMTIALIMGYADHQMYGFDSCLFGDVHHAYDSEDVKEPIEIIVEGSDKKFMAAPYMAAQAQQFQDMLRLHGKFFTPTVHGNGLIAEIMRVGATKQGDMQCQSVS